VSRGHALPIWSFGVLLVIALGCTGPNPGYRARVVTDAPLRPDLAPGQDAARADASVPDAADASMPDAAADSGPDAAPDAAPATLVGHWALDETSGDLARDGSPFGNHGELEGFEPGPWQAGRVGGALLFDRTRLDCGVKVDLQPSLRGLTRFTIAAWTYRTTDTGVHGGILSQQIPGENYESFNLNLDGPDLVLYMYPEQPGDSIEVRVPISGGFNRWLHVAATFDGLAIRLYVDGVVRAARAHAGMPVPSEAPIYLGTNKNASVSNQVFGGLLDDVRLYADALGDTAIASLAAP
jgi:Concanavalin A-like lectin/glucanases superfamily